MVEHTVHETLSQLDYNGLQPFLKMFDQLEEGRSFQEATIDSRGEEAEGSTCAGMSLALLKNLKDEHGIEGMFAALRKGCGQPFEHAAVIVECADGFLFIDPRAVPEDRIFSAPLEGTKEYKYFTLEGSKAGSPFPIKMIYKKTEDHPEEVFEYCTNAANGDGLVMKHFIMEATNHPPHDFIPISCYHLDGAKRKYILVCPNQSKIVLKDENTTKEFKTKEIPFEEIMKEGFEEELKEFMAPNYCAAVPGFHAPLELICRQITQFVSRQSTLKELFKQA